MDFSTLEAFKTPEGYPIYIDTLTRLGYLPIETYSILSGVSFEFIQRFDLIKHEDTFLVDEVNVNRIAVASAVEESNYRAALFFAKIISLGFNPLAKGSLLTPEKAMSVANKMYGEYFATTVNKRAKAKETLGQKKKIKSREKVSEEFKHQQLLKNKHGGATEVLTKSGRIDLLTDDKLIEIKVANGWKSGIGQLMAYSQEYPNHQKTLCLFGDVSKLDIAGIKYILAELDIELEIL